MGRREVLRAAVLGAAGLGLGALTSGCGDGGDGGIVDYGPAEGSLVAAQNVTRTEADAGALAGAAGGFTADLDRRRAADAGSAGNAGNLVCSPYSVAMALGMTRAGAAGRTAQEMDTVLHATTFGSGPAALPAGLNTLALELESRA